MPLRPGIGRAVTGLGRLATRTGDFAGRHPGLVFGGIAVAGARSAHPFRKMDAVIEDAFLGDPDAKGKMVRSVVNTTLMNSNIPIQFNDPKLSIRRQDVYGTPEDPPPEPLPEPYIPYGVTSPPYPRGQSPYLTGSNPNGSLVFGLYNDRLK